MTVPSIGPDDELARHLRRSLAGRLVAEGRIRSRVWRQVFEATPRHLFVPRFHRQDSDGNWRLIDGGNPDQHDEWLSAVYSDETLIVQLLDEPLPAELGGGTHTMFTSSSTAPGLVMRMLETLDVADGHRVLEIGTGSGYNAALLCGRLGADRVTSVDISPDLTDQARTRFAQLGPVPHLVTGDGASGVAEWAPYDRVIATCAVPAIPAAWLAQTAPGGRILTDLRGQIAGALVMLHKHPDGTAVGRFVPEWAGFMYLRHRATVGLPYAAVAEVAGDGTREYDTLLDPVLLVEDPRFAFLVQLHLPHGHLAHTTGTDGAPALRLSTPDGSWCEVGRTQRNGRYPVIEGGPEKLWRVVEKAHHWWQNAGRPSWDRFGLTAADGAQYVWFEAPDSTTRWPLDGGDQDASS